MMMNWNDDRNLRSKIAICNHEWSTPGNLKKIRDKRQWKVEELRLEWNMRPTILKEISHIYFSNLARISVISNQIVSIEGICRLCMPFLQGLSLQLNKIKSVRSLRKAYLPNFENLNLANNLILDGDKLTEAYFPQLDCIAIDSLIGFKPGMRQPNFYDLNFMLKIQSKCVCEISLLVQRQRMQKKLGKNLRSKWKNASIFKGY